MNPDVILSGLILIITFFIVFFIGKLVNDALHRQYKVTHELVEKDNAALALAMVGYYSGLIIALSGILVGESISLVDDLLDITIYGLEAIILLNISWLICDKVILSRFSVTDELIRDQNQGAGAVIASVCIASGFVIFGAVQGEGGHIWTVAIFWIIGQVILVLAGCAYNAILPYDLHAEIEKDNVAAGVSFAGALISLGVIIGLAAEGEFVSWAENLPGFIGYVIIGLVLLPIIRLLTDKVLLPTVKLTDEIANQEKPNVGAAYIEAFAYIASAFIIYWCI